jgi:hypothetical protein
MPVQEFSATINYSSYSLGNLRIREGYLLRKDRWSLTKVFVVLAREKLFEYSNDKKEILLRILCFKHFRLEYGVADIKR